MFPFPKRSDLCLQKSMSAYVSDCYDSIAVFLCIHIILRFRAITAKRNIPALNKSVPPHQSDFSRKI